MNDHRITGERVGSVIKGATYGWMIALGIKTYQRKTKQGASNREAVEAAGWSAVLWPCFVAWFLLWAWVAIAKVGHVLWAYGIGWEMQQHNHALGWARFAVALLLTNLYFILATGILTYEWANRCAWEWPKTWRLYDVGSYLRIDRRWSIKPWHCWALVPVTYMF